MSERKRLLNLQLLEGEGDGAGDGTGTGGTTDFASQDVEVIYGKQEDVPTATSDTTPQPEADTDAEYNQFCERYKERLDKDRKDAVNNAIQKRFKNSTDYEMKLNTLSDALTPLYAKYQVEPGDADGLKKALSEDTTLLEDLAYEKGLTPEALQYQLEMERELKQRRSEDAKREASRKAQEDYHKWVTEAEELKALYPNFDLATEIQDPGFKSDLLKGEKSMKKIYEAAHLDEILSGAIQATANAVRKQTVDNIQARGMRPTENGQKNRPGVVVKSDVKNWTNEDLAEVSRRVRRGETIKL